MKKQIIIILFALLMPFATLAGQGAPENIDNLMEGLSERGAKVIVSRVNDKYQIGTRYNVMFDRESLTTHDSSLRVPSLVDSICLFLDRMSRNCVESYRYESHHNNSDTITYSIALKGYGENSDYVLDLQKGVDKGNAWTSDFKLFQARNKFLYLNRYFQQEQRFMKMLEGNSRNMYFGAKNAILFDYVNGKGNMISLSTSANEAMGTYYHFRPESFDSLLAVLTSQKGVEKHSVHYVHGENESIDKATTYYSTDYLCPENKGKSESEGTLYVVNSKALSVSIYRQLLNEAIRHMDTEPTQCCELEYSGKHFVFDGISNTNRLLINRQALSSYVMADIGKDGTLSILRLEVEGEYWIPRNWESISQSINGKNIMIK